MKKIIQRRMLIKTHLFYHQCKITFLSPMDYYDMEYISIMTNKNYIRNYNKIRKVL